MITRKNCLLIILAIALMLIVFSTGWAETIRLKNGRIFDGIIAAESGGEVKVVMKSGVVTFSRDEIYSIDGRILTPPPPVKKPVVKKPVKSTAVTLPAAPKKEQKVVVKVKKQVTQDKAKETSTFTQFAASTATVASAASAQVTPPNPLPAKPKKGSLLNANSEIIIIAIVLIAIVIVLITKRIKKQ